MNIENIASLAQQLQSLGFENIGSTILKRICFKPRSFIISERIEKQNEQLRFDLYIEKKIEQDAYVLRHYDATLQTPPALTHASINGINTSDLEKRMSEINWKNAFEWNLIMQWSPEDKSTWEKELKIESIVEDLAALEQLEEGKIFAASLMIKHWAGISGHESLGSISQIKSKSEVIQRFYFSEGVSGISVDEAHRFLQNRCLEKQMQFKKKRTDDVPMGDRRHESHGSSRTASRKRKRLVSTKGLNTNNSV
ncbi:MAG: hypothetical protein WKF91_23630 [Segetibacter sp.]